MENKKLNWAIEILKREIDLQTYGSINFKMECGKIVCVKVEKTEKPNIVD